MYCTQTLIIAKINEERRFRNNRLKQRKVENFYNSSNQFSYEYKRANNPTCFSSSSSTSEFDFFEPKPLEMPRTMDLDLYMNFDNEVDIFVSAVASPFAFWVQVVNEDSFKLEDLIQNMNEHYADQFVDNFVSDRELSFLLKHLTVKS